MRSRWLFGLGILCAIIAPGLASASTGVIVDKKIHFRILPHKAYLEMRWFRYKKPKEFKNYFIVRSTSVSSTDPLAGEVVASTTNRYSTNYEDHPPADGTWYYRLCTVTKTLGTICSAATHDTVSGIPKPAVTESFSPTATDPVVLTPPTGELDLHVSMSSSSAALSWTPLLLASSTFSNYKAVRSLTNPDLSYPRDGYLAHREDIQSTDITDTDALFGLIHYRVCAVDDAEHLWCGNVVTVTR